MPNTDYKVRNWKEYNKALKKRGEIIFSFDKNFFANLYYKGKQKRGGKREYSEKMYEYIMTVKVVFRLPWRTATGLVESLLKKAFPEEDVVVPEYSHASRESRKLNLKIKPITVSGESRLELAFDSTGVNVYTTSGWHQRKYGKDAMCRRREQWKKIHVAIDLNSMQVLSVACTDSNTNDCEVVGELCNGIKGRIKNIRADGAYDTEEIRKIIYNLGAQDLIPPARTSKAQDELKKKQKITKEYLTNRDKVIKEIRKYERFDEGLKAWKINSGYHLRSRIEAFMCRFKRIFGFYLQQKTDRGRINEIITKMNILNLMASFGIAKYSD